MTTGKLQVVEPYAITNAAGSGIISGLDNFRTDDPKLVTVFPAGGAAMIIDLGSAKPVDSIFIGFADNAAGTAFVYSCTDIAGSGSVARASGVVIRATDAKSVRASYLFHFASFTSRFWRVDIGSGGAGNVSIGRIALGLSFESSWDREWGSGRRLIDTGKVQSLIGGGFGVQPGARKAAYSWTFGDLTDAEVEQLFGIAYRVGQSSPIIVQEQDGATVGANEKLHYGLFQRFEAFERRDPNATKWALEIEEWI